MNMITIGGTLSASAVALGCMRMSGLDDKQVDAVMDAALAGGINFFDHADIYGGGDAEERFGAYLRRHPGVRDTLLIQTKCALHDGLYDFSKEHILQTATTNVKSTNFSCFSGQLALFHSFIRHFDI